MKKLLLLIVFSCVSALSAAEVVQPIREIIIVSGGPALKFHERQNEHPHDKHWGNFIDSAVVRFGDIKAKASPNDILSWLVYRPGYIERGKEAGIDYLPIIQNEADKLGVALYWFDAREQLINYLNKGKDRKNVKISNFDFFGHSNKACFLFDYSNDIYGMSIVFLHERDLKLIAKDIFAPDANCQSWGCHSGELYSASWRKAFGIPMIGAIGKTDYSRDNMLPKLSKADGKWTQ